MCDKAVGECKWGFCVAADHKLMSVQGSTSEIFDEDGSSTRFYLRYLIDAVSFKYNFDKK